jgi:hypothetical protein
MSSVIRPNDSAGVRRRKPGGGGAMTSARVSSGPRRVERATVCIGYRLRLCGSRKTKARKSDTNTNPGGLFVA